jgi:hypothetical protein
MVLANPPDAEADWIVLVYAMKRAAARTRSRTSFNNLTMRADEKTAMPKSTLKSNTYRCSSLSRAIALRMPPTLSELLRRRAGQNSGWIKSGEAQ